MRYITSFIACCLVSCLGTGGINSASKASQEIPISLTTKSQPETVLPSEAFIPTPVGVSKLFAAYLVTARKLNVRLGPGLGFLQIGALPKGRVVTVIEQRGDWMQIAPNRWVCGRYLQIR